MAKKRSQPEHDEQVRLFNWARDNEEEYPELRNMFAIPNGGARHLFVAKKLKASPNLKFSHFKDDYSLKKLARGSGLPENKQPKKSTLQGWIREARKKLTPS